MAKIIILSESQNTPMVKSSEILKSFCSFIVYSNFQFYNVGPIWSVGMDSHTFLTWSLGQNNSG